MREDPKKAAQRWRFRRKGEVLGRGFMLLRVPGMAQDMAWLFGGESCFSRTEGLSLSLAAVRGLRSHLCLQSSRSRLRVPGLGDRSCHDHHPVRLRAAMGTDRAHLALGTPGEASVYTSGPSSRVPF